MTYRSPTPAERKAQERARKAAQGLKRIEEYVYPEDEEALRRLAQELREAREREG